MKIGIIGCGYIGQAMALHWRKKGHFVSVTTRKREKMEHLQSLADEVFLLGPRPLSSFLEGQEAILLSVAPDHFSDYASTYLSTAQEIAKFYFKLSHLRQVLYTGSTSVYGDHFGAWVDENAKLLNSHENAKTLYETEKTLLGSGAEKPQVCILRLGEIYGPGREIEERLRRMQSWKLPGSGESFTNIVHLDDIVAALDFALERQLSGIYNLCSDFHIPRKDFYDQICTRKNLPAVQWDPLLQSHHGGNRRVLSQKIKDAGFVFNASFASRT